MKTQEGRRVTALDLTLQDQNPNHKYRMALMAVPPPFYWLAELGLVKKDESLYLMPLIEREYTLTMSTSDGHRSEHRIVPNSGLHISIHHSGAVNVSWTTESVRLREATGAPSAFGPVFAVSVTSTAGLREATTDEINSSPASKRVVPLVGAWRPAPIGMTVYRSDASTPWTAPILGDYFQANIHLPVQEKGVKYHVIVWQHDQFKAKGGEILIYLPAK